MNIRVAAGGAIVMLTSLSAASSYAAEATPLLKDLTTVIALHGQPCGQVVSAVRKTDSDYLASCADGTRYRVYTNAKDRVVVEKQQ